MTKKRWLITGISTGFGRVMAEKLLAQGDDVAGTVRDLSTVEPLKAQYGDRLWVAELDLTHTMSIRGVVDRAWVAFGRIDVVVSNAGYGLVGAAEELIDEMIEHQIDTNLLGSIQLIRTALPHLRAQGGGRILQLSSMGGQVAFPGGSLYHATKRALKASSKPWRKRLPSLISVARSLSRVAQGRIFRYRSAQVAPMLEAYDVSPSRMVNRLLTDATHQSPGDPAKMVDVMIASVDQHPAPRRIALGSDAYEMMHAQLPHASLHWKRRRGLALSTDFPAGQGNDQKSRWFEKVE